MFYKLILDTYDLAVSLTFFKIFADSFFSIRLPERPPARMRRQVPLQKLSVRPATKAVSTTAAKLDLCRGLLDIYYDEDDDTGSFLKPQIESVNSTV